jgi:hypothetical protein
MLDDERFEVFTAVTIKNGVFWDVTTCGTCKNRVSEERSTSFIRVARIGELGTTLAVTSNRRTPRHATPLHATPRHSTPRHATRRNISEDAILHVGRSLHLRPDEDRIYAIRNISGQTGVSCSQRNVHQILVRKPNGNQSWRKRFLNERWVGPLVQEYRQVGGSCENSNNFRMNWANVTA